jgi:tetratricopeptide (TPR) repeat protein
MGVKKIFVICVCAIPPVLFSTLALGERISSHFNRLPLMRDEALRDGNERAVRNVDYVQNTHEGEYFEVDNEKPPIESIVTKKNKTRQSKPLESKTDEDLLIAYYKKVDSYAQDYDHIKTSFQMKKISEPIAMNEFKSLFAKYPKFSSSPRAIGVIHLSQGQAQEASVFFRMAIETNNRDPIALASESIAIYALGMKIEAKSFAKKAKEVDPTLSFLGSWEIDYLLRRNPEIYKDWRVYMDLK